MDHKTFAVLVESRLDHCRRVLTDKGEEYSRDGNRLHNFYTAARMEGVSPAKALWGMFLKHLVSIRDMVSDGYATPRYLDEKISDGINYLLLLEGLLRDAANEAGGTPGEPADYGLLMVNALSVCHRENAPELFTVSTIVDWLQREGGFKKYERSARRVISITHFKEALQKQVNAYFREIFRIGAEKGEIVYARKNILSWRNADPIVRMQELQKWEKY